MNEQRTYFGDPGRAIRHQGVAAPEPFIPRRRQPSPNAAENEAEQAGSFGFPAPPPPPPHTVAEPAAVGGVHFQPFRDPRPADGSAPMLGRRHSAPAQAAGHHDDAPSHADATAAGRASSGFEVAHRDAAKDGRDAAPAGRRDTPGARRGADIDKTGHRDTGASVSGPKGDASTASHQSRDSRIEHPGEASGIGHRADASRAGHRADVSRPGHRADTSQADHQDDAVKADHPDSSASSSGKHTVPDELVRAATYRLPPDRVFRAKVPNSTPLPEQTTTHLSLPKPRRRTDDNVVPPP
ncbi:hypothetical protein OWR29_18325 [Actinoplanes sp. Pm04-4]|uniref:Uncharacterized protein n=1 Tax=Paractinoplanes pyxinae TaxID=2997416 RepID=A0ABT4B0I5_9ACTN|nr:hypothetical protein [Actinoplanes pyxinae]MCY1139964.1 hypothetical protein [Actinoplanes pyxinae]